MLAAFQNVIVAQVGLPAVGSEDVFVKALVGKIKPGGTEIVEVGEASLRPSALSQCS